MKKIISLLLALLLLGSLSVTAHAAENLEALLDFVTDDAGILTGDEKNILEETAEDISERYQCGVYIAIVEDHTAVSSGDVMDVAEAIYQEYRLGCGEKKDGVLLFLSVDDRQAALMTHDGSRQFITAEGKDWLASQYLPHFRRSDWEEGFSAYLEGCDTLLEMAAKGKPMTSLTTPSAQTGGILVSLGLGFVIAWCIVAVMKGKQKSVFKATMASEYMVQGGVNLVSRNDQFTHRTTSRRKIVREPSRSGGSRGVGSQGFSNRTDKF